MTVVVTDDHALPGEAAGGAGAARWTPGRPTGDRRAHALAALAAAELRTGVRQAVVRPPLEPHEPREPREPGGLSGARRALPPRAPDTADRLPVHPAVAGLLPGGGLPVGGTFVVQGSTSLLLGLLAAASADGAWVAFVGAPAIGLAAAADAGLHLERVAVVPAPGADAPAVVAALLDGVDVVVLGPAVALLGADRRRLAARARERGAVLMTTTPWPGAHVTLDVRGGSWWGVDHGAGWLRRRVLRVGRTGRGAAARPLELVVEVPVAPAPGERTPVLEPAETTPRVVASTTGNPGLRVVA